VSEPAGALYVYGVVRAGETLEPAVAGVGDEAGEIQLLAHGDVAAVVSEVEGGPLAAARDLRAHWRVLEAIAETATVVPVRFGTVVANRNALVDEFLAPRSERLLELLNEVSGKVQLNLKGFYDEERLLREVVTASPAVARMRERVQAVPAAAGYYDRIRLGELVSGEVERRREQDSALVLHRLEPLAVAARSEAAATADMAVNAVFLVDRTGVEDFSKEVAKLAEELGERMQLRYLGPMPPYSFADAEVEAGGAAWD
jgi:hypothetical protein